LFFDPSQLTIEVPGGIAPGADTAGGWVVSSRLVAPGHLRVGMVNSHGRPLTPGLREIAQLLFRVADDTGGAASNPPGDDRWKPALRTADGISVLDIEPVDPRSGGYTWTAVDGSVSITPAAARHSSANPHVRNGAALLAPAEVPNLVLTVASDLARSVRPSAGPVRFAGHDLHGGRAFVSPVVSTAVDRANARSLSAAKERQTPGPESEPSSLAEVLDELAHDIAFAWRQGS
jgi:hypothetical protein